MPAPNHEFVKTAKRAEAKLNRRAAQIAAAKKAEIRPKIIALQRLPIRRVSPFGFEPVQKFEQRLPIIPLRVNRRAAIRCEVLEKILNPLILDFLFDFLVGRFHSLLRGCFGFL